jgi:glycosyltransferase involved in cell wall biosynthesis
MRVLWVLKQFGVGGAERLLLEMSPDMGATDLTIVAVELGSGELLPAFAEAGLGPRVLAGSFKDPRWILRLRTLIRSERPDLVHAHLPVAGIGTRLALLGLPVPLVYTEHNPWKTYHPLTRWGNAGSIRLTGAIVAVSDQVRGSIMGSRLGRALADRTTTIHNGIDADRVRREAEEDPTGIGAATFGAIISLQRPQKGADVLVRAVSILQADFPGNRCVILGEGPFLAPVRRLAEKLGVASAIEFPGRRMDARAIMSRLEVVVLPSRNEGLPLVLLEAMALGRPVVASAVGGIPEVIEDGVNGLLVRPDDPTGLAAAIARLLGDPDLRASMSAAARRTVEQRWSLHETAERYLALYERQLAAVRER